jgi:hypothetical protein
MARHVTLAARAGPPRERRDASFVLRVEQRPDGRCRYVLHDLRSGELRRFWLRVHLQRWLRAALRHRLR